MKRFALIALICAFVMGATSSAFATDLVVKGGDIRVVGQWVDNADFDADTAEDEFHAYERMRAAFQFVANEHLRADIELEFVNDQFGDSELAMGGTNAVATRKAYMTFDIPGTEATVKAGMQGFAVPSATGYMSILDDRLAGVVVGTPITDAIGVNLAWFRVSDAVGAGGDEYSDDVDVLYASLPVNCDGYNVTPWGLYEFIGDDTTTDENPYAFWLGIGTTVDMFDPIVVMADFQYGSYSTDTEDNATKGWLFDLAVDYKMDMFTPELFFAYASGSDDDNDGGENMPTISGDTYYTTFVLDGSAISSGDIINQFDGANGANTVTGLWALGFKLKDITFMENLSHTFTVLYAQGTNDKDSGMAITEEDSLIEVNFDSKYQIYEQLAAIVEMGYADVDIEDVDTDAAYKLAVGFKYSF